MVLTREELSRALQHEIAILLHFAGKLEPAMLDYRPTPKQRSALELLRYLQQTLAVIAAQGVEFGQLEARWSDADTRGDRAVG